MTGPFFVDTNVLVYNWDTTDAVRQHRAAEWLRALADTRTGRVSFQVLSEFFVNATQKLRVPVEKGEARTFARGLCAWNPVPVDGALLEGAWQTHDRYRVSWWDALIVAAAQRARCRTLLSEDFQAGQDFDGLTVVNPFATAPPEP